MDPLVLSSLIGAGGSLLGSLFGGGGPKKPTPKYSNEAQDIMFGDLSSMLANYGSPVIPALAHRALGDKYSGMFGPQTAFTMNPYALKFTGTNDQLFQNSNWNTNYMNPRMGGMGARGFGFGGGNLGQYTAGAPNAWSQKPFFSS